MKLTFRNEFIVGLNNSTENLLSSISQKTIMIIVFITFAGNKVTFIRLKKYMDSEIFTPITAMQFNSLRTERDFGHQNLMPKIVRKCPKSPNKTSTQVLIRKLSARPF